MEKLKTPLEILSAILSTKMSGDYRSQIRWIIILVLLAFSTHICWIRRF